MMKSYLRYEPEKSFGVIASLQCNVVHDWSGNIVLSSSGDTVSVWNVRQGSLISTLTNNYAGYPHILPGEVTYIACSPDKISVAAGYTTGEICMFQYLKSTGKSASLRGHQTGVSCLVYNSQGTLLASGGRDSDIVVWDTVSLTGMCRLRGHKDAVTGVAFLNNNDSILPSRDSEAGNRQLLVSVSKDTLLKVWDLSTQHCIQTIVGHRCEIWSLAVLHSSSDTVSHGSDEDTSYVLPTIVTGAADDLVRAYRIRVNDGNTLGDDESIIEYAGCMQLSGGEKCSHLEFNSTGTVLAALSGQKTLEIFKFRSLPDAKKKLKRRLRRIREKSTKQETTAEIPQIGSEEQIVLTDCVEPFTVIRCPHKIRSFAISCKQNVSKKNEGQDSLVLSMINNSMEFYSIIPGKSKSDDDDDENQEGTGAVKKSVIELPGHRSDVRCVALSSDGLQIASCSSDGLRIWNSSKLQCMRRCATGYGVALVFAPGNRYAIVGTREGRLQVVDCAVGDLVLDLEAHTGALWSLAVSPDGKGLISGGADKAIKFWEFSVTGSTLSLSPVKEMEMTHDVLCVRYSPSRSVEKSLVAVGLLDATVKIFFSDSLKFYLSLYGHKLAVMCLDISYDSTLLISGSADKTIKIWGLDFGDCHRSLIGHEDSVTCVRFQPETHYFFSASKDGCVKYWDADRFLQILTLPGHFSCVWGLDVSHDASFFVSGSQDRSMRVWRRTEDLVFIEEERDRAFEAQVETAAVTSNDAVPGAEFSAVAQTQSVESFKSGERLLESIDLVESELGESEGIDGGRNNNKSSNPLLLGKTPLGYLVHVLRNIRPSDLEQALLVLPFHSVTRLIGLLVQLCNRGTDVELVAKCCLFLFRAHQPQILSTQALSNEVIGLADSLRTNLAGYRMLVGTNMAALRFSQKHHEEEIENKLTYRAEIVNIQKKSKNGGSSTKRKNSMGQNGLNNKKIKA